jgi:hypothetical protein
MKSASEMAARLKEIQTDKLWEGEYTSFEDYCQKRWGFGRSRACQILGAENTRLFLADVAKDEPEVLQNVNEMNEGQLRVIAQVEPEKRLDVIRKAISDGSKPTPAKLRKAAGIEKVKQVCPHCHQTF